MVFSLSVLWWRRIRGFWKLPDGRDWLRGILGLVLMGGAMLNKSLIQFSVEGRGCVSTLLFDLRTNCGGGNEDDGDLLQKVPWCTAALGAPSPAAGDRWPMPPPETPGHSQASLGQSLVGSLLLSPGSWCTQSSVCALQESVSPVLCKFWWLYGGGYWQPPPRGLMPYPDILHPEPLPLQPSTADPYLPRRHSNTVLSQSLWGLWVLVHTRYVWALWASLVGIGFDSKSDFTPPTILLEFLLCLCTWGISSLSFQHCAARELYSMLN